MNLSVLEPLPVSQHELLSTDECDELRDRILSLRSEWIERGYHFYSLGAASYLDAPDHHAEYLASAAKTNLIVREHFADTFATLTEFLSDLLGDRVAITDTHAVPGFHVFEYDGRPRSNDKPSSRAHFDLQWMNALPDRDLRGTISYTVVIEQPTGGASLEVWPLRFSQNMTATARDYAESHASRRLAYETGSVTIHDGHVLHAIGLSESPNPRGRRITLQGHGALIDGVWMLYW